ncbi:YggT family protein [Paradesulfitobacterium aromaticivorans]
MLIYAIIIRAFLSFIPHSPRNQLIRLLYDVTEPLLKPFRRFQLGSAGFALDFSPILAVFALSILRSILLRIVAGLMF